MPTSFRKSDSFKAMVSEYRKIFAVFAGFAVVGFGLPVAAAPVFLSMFDEFDQFLQANLFPFIWFAGTGFFVIGIGLAFLWVLMSALREYEVEVEKDIQNMGVDQEKWDWVWEK